MTDIQRPTVAVIGGGYGGIAVSRALDDQADVVLVEPREAFHHNVAALRALVAPDWLERIFLPYDRLLAHGRVVRDRAVHVEPGLVRLASGAELHPDYIVLATGSRYPFPAKSAETDAAEAITRYRAAYEDLAKAPRVMLLGAGAVGIELAGEIAAAWPDKRIVLVDIADDVLPGPFDPRVRAEVNRQLDRIGVQRVLGSALRSRPDTEPGEPGSFTVTTEDGVAVEADLWFQCYGVTPVTDYLAGTLAGAVRPDGYLDLTPALHIAGAETVYAVGDIVGLDPARRAAAAARHAAVVVANIQAHAAGNPERTEYTAPPTAIILPIGPEGGTGQLPAKEDILTAEFVAELKGRDMMIDRYAALFGN